MYTSIPETKRGRGQPRREATGVLLIRLPLTMIAVIERRAKKAHMAPSVYLAERVIWDAVMRDHDAKRKRR